MIIVRWGNHTWPDEDREDWNADDLPPGPVEKWHKKVFPDVDDTFNAYVFFRKKDADPRWDVVELVADKSQ